MFGVVGYFSCCVDFVKWVGGVDILWLCCLGQVVFLDVDKEFGIVVQVKFVYGVVFLCVDGLFVVVQLDGDFFDCQVVVVQVQYFYFVWGELFEVGQWFVVFGFVYFQQVCDGV